MGIATSNAQDMVAAVLILWISVLISGGGNCL